ncbi:MAG: FtsQ-type POTRA domain-containing protein [Candidatus Dojkabacteria bacterium]
MDDDIKIEKKPKTFLKEKLSRFRPVLFLKKNIVIFSFLFIFLITTLLGVWNIKRYEIFDQSGSDIDTKVYTLLEEYIKGNVLGKNFFELNSNELSKNLYKDISYVESVKVEKSIPNKVILFTNIFTPKLVAYLKDSKCYLLSKEGYQLEEICKDSEKKCCEAYATTNALYYFSSSEVGIAKLDQGKSKLLIMEDVRKVVTVIEQFKYTVSVIELRENILMIKTLEGKTFTFTFSSDLDIQLERCLVVMSKIKGDNLKFKTLDLRFERPVMKN